MAKVAVIILNWNGAGMLRRFLPEVIAATDESVAEIVVADNGSTDDSLGVLAREFPGVRVIKFDDNHGFAGGYNLAIDRVESEYTVLLNSDVAASPRWVDTLLAYMEAHPRCAACQPKILSSENRGQFEYAGAAGGYIDRNGYPYCRGRLFGTVEDDLGQYDSPAQCDWASGAALMVRRDLYLKAGGLDARFFAHMEEIDLCWRLRSMGYTVDAVPSAVVYHLGGGSLPMGNPRKTYLNFRNNLLLLYKNLPRKGRGWRLFKRRLLDGVAAAKFLLGGDLAGFKAVVKAHRDYSRLRREYAAEPPIAPAAMEPRPNILTEYYIKRHQKFSQLSQKCS